MKPRREALGIPRKRLLPLLLFFFSVAGLADPSALSECTRAFYRGDYSQAAALAERHLRKYPADAPVRVMLARCALAQGEFLKAIEELRKAHTSDPRNIDALYYLSLAAKELSQREYQRLFSIAPDSARVHQLLGEAALAAENHTEAEAEFQNALKANPRSIEAATELAELKRSQSKFDEALAYYAQAEKIGPLNYDIAYGLGACYTYKQNYPEAIRWFRKAVAFSPDSVAGQFALGNALFQSSNFDAAIPELKMSLQLEPRMKQAYFLLGRAYSKLGRQAEAQAAFGKLDELNRSEVPNPEKGSNSDPSPKPEIP